MTADTDSRLVGARTAQPSLRRFAYVYFMKPDADRVGSVAPRHALYWRQLGLADYRGGPFGDRSGGLIIFAADDAVAAERAVQEDPFVREALVETHWLKPWTPE